jgi:hypothetical protein
MYAFRLRAAAVALVAGVGLTGCMTPYGSGLSVGLGNGGYYNPYYGSGYGYNGYGYNAGYGYGYPGYGYGYAPYYGWYDDFYYPGTGYYVYDIYRQPHRWTDAQREYWEARRKQAISSKDFREQMEAQAQNWSAFDARPTATTTQVRTQDGKRVRVERTRPVRVERQRTERTKPVKVERSTATRTDRSTDRIERQTARAERRSEARLERTSRASTRRNNASEE